MSIDLALVSQTVKSTKICLDCDPAYFDALFVFANKLATAVQLKDQSFDRRQFLKDCGVL